MAKTEPAPDFASIFMDFGRDLKLPTPELETMVERHRKNLAALDEAARKAGSGAGEILNRQRAMMQEALDEISTMAEQLSKDTTPKSVMAAQSDFARKTFEATLRNTSEIAEMARKSGMDTFKVLQDSMQQTLADMREIMTKPK